MSVSNLFFPNDFDIFANSIQCETITANNLNFTNETLSNLEVSDYVLVDGDANIIGTLLVGTNVSIGSNPIVLDTKITGIDSITFNGNSSFNPRINAGGSGVGQGIIYIQDVDGEGKLRIGANQASAGFNFSTANAGTTGIMKIRDNSTGSFIVEIDPTTGGAPINIRADTNITGTITLDGHLGASGDIDILGNISCSELDVQTINGLGGIFWDTSGRLTKQNIAVGGGNTQYQLSTSSSVGNTYLMRRQTLHQSITGTGGGTTIISFKALDTLATISDRTGSGQIIKLQFQQRASGEPNTQHTIWFNNFSGGSSDIYIDYVDLDGNIITAINAGASIVIYDNLSTPNWGSAAGTYNFPVSATITPVGNVCKIEVVVSNETTQRYGMYVNVLR